jgi:hypothetical protein
MPIDCPSHKETICSRCARLRTWVVAPLDRRAARAECSARICLTNARSTVAAGFACLSPPIFSPVDATLLCEDTSPHAHARSTSGKSTTHEIDEATCTLHAVLEDRHTCQQLCVGAQQRLEQQDGRLPQLAVPHPGIRSVRKPLRCTGSTTHMWLRGSMLQTCSAAAAAAAAVAAAAATRQSTLNTPRLRPHPWRSWQPRQRRSRC